MGSAGQTARRKRTSLLAPALGLALFAFLVWWVGPTTIWNGFRQIGWGLLWILLLGGIRFAVRAGAWSIAIEPPHRLRFIHAFAAVISGDALGNLTPLGPIVGEPAKVACVRGHVPLGVALTALAIENVLYTVTVAIMIAAGAVALLASVDLPAGLREFSEVAIAGVVLLLAIGGWILWRRPALPVRLLGGQSRLEKLRRVEQQVYTFAQRRRSAMPALLALELAFHACGVAEKQLALWLILGHAPPLLYAFIIETADRLITVAFKFVPYQVGVGEVGTGLITQLLGLGTAPGVTLSIVRKARMGAWSLVGYALLVRQGLTARRILDDAELTVPRSDSI